MESISEFLQKIKNFTAESGSRGKLLVIITIFLVGSASFGLGRLSALENRKEPVRIDFVESSRLSASVSAAISSHEDSGNKVNLEENQLPAGGFLVGSKNGDKYHFPWCSGAQRILEENKVYFASVEEARAAGYTPAGNCKGLE